jgi:hypothetical protein
MENTMTTSGDVDTTVAMTRVWHQPSVLGDTPVRRLAAVPAPFQGTALPAAARTAIKTIPTSSTMDVPFRTGRPPV